ncbi:MAG TPA: hypothetical protein VG323_19855 [Thermoanaerobaculia bacterium]|nr:hypothetical protein [Thermoanaerobaculia bacterium]
MHPWPAPAPEPEPEPGFSGGRAAGIAIALLFLIVRIVYLYARQPFFDELYTQWMAGEPLSSIVPHLLHDSGPPLYYFLARLPSVIALRWESLLFAAIAFVLVLRKFPLAAALLAVYPAAALYATEGRAYALCAMFVAVGVLLLDEEQPFAAMAAFVLAAYSHYYGVLFFPLLLIKDRRAFFLAAALFIPGFVLAFHQPAEAMEWNVVHPWWVLLVSIAVAALLARTWRFAPAVLIPAALVAAFALVGRNVYFPGRFESILAAPLALWAAASLERWRPPMRRAFVALLMIAGLALIAAGVVDERRQPPDPRLRAASIAAGAPVVVASDYCYLAARVQLGQRVRAFPPEQAEHPGWYRPPTQEAALAAARSLPTTGFVFIADAGTLELAAVARVRRVQLRYRDGPAVVATVEPLTSTVH